jgi:putative CocE/NonD family hydrolase
VAECARFFDPYVRGIGEPLSGPRRAKWNLGHVGYFETDDWPPRGREILTFYFANGEQAAGGAGGLSGRPDAHPTVARWTHDPNDPVPSPTEMDPAWLVLRHYPDMSPLATRGDVLTFTSDPLADPIDIVGTPRVQLRVASTGPSMHVFGRMQDVDPDGRANPISSWQVVINDPDPDRVVQLDLSPLAYRIRSQHQLRLQLASSDHPYYLVHPGTDENPWFAATRVANQQTLITGGTALSHLEVPVMRALPERTGAIVG